MQLFDTTYPGIKGHTSQQDLLEMGLLAVRWISFSMEVLFFVFPDKKIPLDKAGRESDLFRGPLCQDRMYECCWLVTL